MCGMWALWMMRNKHRHGELWMTVQQAVNWVKDTAFDLWQLGHRLGQPSGVHDIPTWKRPELGWVKLNTDAAFFVESKQGATLCVIRDERGVFQTGQATWYERALDACSMESVACRDGLQLAARLGLRRVAVETDCLQFVHPWRKESQRSVIDPILKEIDEVCLAFQEFSISCVSRSCNKVAHVLAKQVYASHRLETWHVTPTCVYDLIMFEASAS
jgi:ribonuclease HI